MKRDGASMVTESVLWGVGWTHGPGMDCSVVLNTFHVAELAWLNELWSMAFFWLHAVRDWHTLSYDRQYDKSKKLVETERIAQRFGRGRGTRGGPSGRGGPGRGGPPGRGGWGTPFGRPRMPVAQPVSSGPVGAGAGGRAASAPMGGPRFQGPPPRHGGYGFTPRGGFPPRPGMPHPGMPMGGGMLGRGPPGMGPPPRGPRGGNGAPRESPPGPGRGRGVHTTKPHWMQ